MFHAAFTFLGLWIGIFSTLYVVSTKIALRGEASLPSPELCAVLLIPAVLIATFLLFARDRAAAKSSSRQKQVEAQSAG